MSQWTSLVALFVLCDGVTATTDQLHAGSSSGRTHWYGGAGVRHDVSADSLRIIPRRRTHDSVTEGSDTGRESRNDLQVHPQGRIVAGAIVSVSGWEKSSQWDVDSQAQGIEIFPPHGDIVAAYCPHNASDEDYLDYREIQQGNKTVMFGPLINMRCEYEFRYLAQDANGSYRFIAASPSVGFALGPEQPTQGHLSETGHPGEMNVMWVSNQASPTVVEVRDANAEGEAWRTVTGKSHTYIAQDMCNHPANITGSLQFRDPGHIHRVKLTDLKPRMRYVYRFGFGTSFSPEYSFRTAPPVGDASEPISFFVFGDLGEEQSPTGPAEHGRALTTMERIGGDIKKRAFDFLLHVGDISYAEGRGYRWEQFGFLIQNVATSIPYYLGTGNHDYDHDAGGDKDPSRAPGNGYHPSWGSYGDDSGGECAVPIVSRYSMPSAAPSSLAPFWYSHDYGMVHLVWLSTEHNYYPGSDMHNFLVTDLKAVDRKRTPWVFVMGHRPMYCSRAIGEITAKDNYIIQLHQREAYEDVLYQYGVDVFFGGHYHAYERTCPVYNGSCRETESGHAKATVHMLLGTGGANQDFDRWDEQPWSRHRGIDYGYGRVHVANSTHLLVEYVLNVNGSVADSAWIVSSHDWGTGMQ